MAKKNVRDEPLKPQVTENEQMSDIVLILDKMELLLQAVSKLDKDGRYETVPGGRPPAHAPWPAVAAPVPPAWSPPR